MGKIAQKFLVFLVLALLAGAAKAAYTTAWSETFEEASLADLATRGFTLSNTGGTEILIAERTISDTKKSNFLEFNGTKSGNVTFVAPDDFKVETDYTVEFDWFCSGGFSGTSSKTVGDEVQIFGSANSGTWLARVKANANNWAQKGTLYTNGVEVVAQTFSSNSARGNNPTAATEVSYWYHIKVIGSHADDCVKLTITDGNGGAVVTDMILSDSFITISKLYFNHYTSAYSCSGGFDDIVLKVSVGGEVPSNPTIDADDASISDIRTITVTQTAMAEGAKTYWYLRSAGSNTAAEYTAPIKLTATDTVCAYTQNGTLKSELVSLYVQAGIVTDPVVSYSAVNGTSRTISVAKDEGDSLQYSTTGVTGSFEDVTTTSFTYDADTTVYFRAKRVSAVDASVTLYSAVVSFTVKAGVTEKLAAPSKVFESGVAYLGVTADESGVQAAPTGADIVYTIDGGAEQRVALGGSFETAYIPITSTIGANVTIWVACTGYDNSESISYTVPGPSAKYARVKVIDAAGFTRANPTSGITKDSTLRDSAFKIDDTTTLDVQQVKIGSTVLDSAFLIMWEEASGSGKPLRWGTNQNRGVYNDRTNKYFVLKDLKKGDILYVNATGTSLPTYSNLALNDSLPMSNYASYYTVQTDGPAVLNINAYNYISALVVYRRKPSLIFLVQ